MTNPNPPRSPAREELQQLAEHVAESHEYMPTAEQYAEARDFVEGACIAVFDHYVSDSADYTGKLMLVAWHLGLECYEAYYWRNGQLEVAPQDGRFGLA